MEGEEGLAGGISQGTSKGGERSTALEHLLACTCPCRLQPFRFFVSWQGVLTMAYTGFPPAIVELKRAICEAAPSLQWENPGSLWPKTSLGALNDRARLTPGQLDRLNAICREESAALNSSANGDLAVWVDRAAVAVYECRSLERLLSYQEVAFGGGTPDEAPPADEDRRRTLAIVSEADDPDYWFAASRDGNRVAHYRGHAVGATLIHRLAAFGGGDRVTTLASPLPALVAEFRARVDSELPDMYVWFADESLHVTLRALTS